MTEDYAPELFQAYRSGLLRKRDFTPRDLNFSTLISQSTVGWPFTTDRKFLRGTANVSYEGLLEARRGNHDKARAAFAEARGYLDRLDGALELIGIALYEAAVAYLDHREGRHELARDRVRKALDADLALERDHDLWVMLVHRVQQGHNLARVDLKLGNRRPAIELCGLLVAFLEDRVESLPFHEPWSKRTLRGLSGYLTRGIIGQISGETASHIINGPDPEAEWDVFLDAARPSAPTKTTRFPQALHALCAQDALRKGDRRAWFEHSKAFFVEGPAYCPDLFYAQVVSFAEDCRTSGLPWADQVADAVERDSAKWRGCNPYLRRRLLSAA